jgi:hypothetical protein
MESKFSHHWYLTSPPFLLGMMSTSAYKTPSGPSPGDVEIEIDLGGSGLFHFAE